VDADRQRLAMLQQQEDEKRRAEEARTAREAASSAEEQRLASLKAVEGWRNEDSIATKPKNEQEPTINAAELARSLQGELKRVGCDPGAVDGPWGAKAKDALREFSRTAKVTLSVEEPTEDALKSVAAQKGRVCVLKCGANEREKGGRCVAVATAKPEQVTSKGTQPTHAPLEKNCAFGFRPGGGGGVGMQTQTVCK
jgi:hypothetical protein